MSKRKDKSRVSVTMTETYLEFLDDLIDQGLYLARGEIVLEALRKFAKDMDIDLPYDKDKVK